jgi:HSP20 family molecular chaperone IbpA
MDVFLRNFQHFPVKLGKPRLYKPVRLASETANLDMSIARQFLNEFRPLFRMLEEPFSRSPAYYPSRSVFDDPFFKNTIVTRPAVDVTDEGNKYVLEADLPGVKKENLEVRIGDSGRSVTVEGKFVDRRRQPQGVESSEGGKSALSSLVV